MAAGQVRALIQAFSVSKRSEIDEAWKLADTMTGDLVTLLAEAFPRVSMAAGRASILRYIGKFSRESDVVFRLGIAAVRDRSYPVRHYACALLAYSLKFAALPTLTSLLVHRDARTVKDAKAAIDAIVRRNHNFFQDRRHTGKVRWEYGST